MRAKTPPESLAIYLKQLHSRWNHPRHIGMDPLRWPRMYKSREDQEIASFLAASLAYGNVIQINRSLENLFKRMGRSPSAFARNFRPGKSDAKLDGFYHRFNTSRDLAALIHLLGQILRGWGTLEAFWSDAQRKELSTDVLSFASHAGRFISKMRQLDFTPYIRNERLQSGKERPRDSLLYLLPEASGSSACKRLNMFLRWVVRDDGVDLGLWKSVPPAQLEYPVDTHILRIASYLGATRRKTADARAREEITAFFRRISPEDPVQFDFSLCRMGILKQCPRRSEIERCESCELKPACGNYRKLVKSEVRRAK